MTKFATFEIVLLAVAGWWSKTLTKILTKSSFFFLPYFFPEFVYVTLCGGVLYDDFFCFEWLENRIKLRGRYSAEKISMDG